MKTLPRRDENLNSSIVDIPLRWKPKFFNCWHTACLIYLSKPLQSVHQRSGGIRIPRKPACRSKVSWYIPFNANLLWVISLLQLVDLICFICVMCATAYYREHSGKTRGRPSMQLRCIRIAVASLLIWDICTTATDSFFYFKIRMGLKNSIVPRTPISWYRTSHPEFSTYL